jgi:hypothetical protein
MRKCSVWWCNKRHYAKSYCIAHYRAYKRFGTPYGKHDAQFKIIDAEINKLKSELNNALELLQWRTN